MSDALILNAAIWTAIIALLIAVGVVLYRSKP